MGERKYSVAEIDSLRSACKQLYLYGTTSPVAGFSRSYREADMVKAVEEMVRTYMVAGVDPDELWNRDRTTEDSPHG